MNKCAIDNTHESTASLRQDRNESTKYGPVVPITGDGFEDVMVSSYQHEFPIDERYYTIFLRPATITVTTN